MIITPSKAFENIKKYHSEGLTNKQIVRLTNLTNKQITSFINRNNLTSNKYEVLNLSDNFKQLLIGSYLGDGSFTKISGLAKQSKFSIAHSLKQKEYFLRKWKVFEIHNLEGKIMYNKVLSNRYKNGYFEEIRFKSKSHPLFTKFREEGYSETKKKLNIELVKDINKLGLAIWYMDDGSITGTSCNIASNKFSENERFLLRDLIYSKFNILTNITQTTLYIPTKEFSLFKEIVKPYIIEEMKYKLNTYKSRMGSV